MKNIQCLLLTILLLSLFTAGYAQMHFPNKDGEWYVKKDLGENYIYDYPPFKVVGDTTINELNYSIIECSSIIYCAIRSSASKVYYINLNYPEYGENLLYDFGLKAGDFISLNYFYTTLDGTSQIYNNDTLTWKVTEISKIDIKNEQRKLIKLTYDDFYLDEWIEGIGSINSPLHTLTYKHSSFQYSYLYCYREGETGLYGNCNNVGIKQTSAEQDLFAFDSSYKQLYINNSLKTGQNFIFIYNLQGKLVWQCKRIYEDHLDLSFLKPGLYMCHITLAEKNQIKRIVIH